jgi:hypothetical protein
MNHGDILADESHVGEVADQARSLQMCLEQRIMETNDFIVSAEARFAGNHPENLRLPFTPPCSGGLQRTAGDPAAARNCRVAKTSTTRATAITRSRATGASGAQNSSSTMALATTHRTSATVKAISA